MPGTISSVSSVYLTKVDGELTLQHGHNPNRFSNAHKRILVIGGGVIGMTVSFLLLRVLLCAN